MALVSREKVKAKLLLPWSGFWCAPLMTTRFAVLSTHSGEGTSGMVRTKGSCTRKVHWVFFGIWRIFNGIHPISFNTNGIWIALESLQSPLFACPLKIAQGSSHYYPVWSMQKLGLKECMFLTWITTLSDGQNKVWLCLLVVIRCQFY